MLLERVPETALSDAEAAASVLCATYDPNTDWQAWARGRVFCSTWELRWERAGRAIWAPDAPAGLRRRAVVGRVLAP